MIKDFSCLSRQQKETYLLTDQPLPLYLLDTDADRQYITRCGTLWACRCSIFTMKNNHSFIIMEGKVCNNHDIDHIKILIKIFIIATVGRRLLWKPEKLIHLSVSQLSILSPYMRMSIYGHIVWQSHDNRCGCRGASLTYKWTKLLQHIDLLMLSWLSSPGSQHIWITTLTWNSGQPYMVWHTRSAYSIWSDQQIYIWPHCH